MRPASQAEKPSTSHLARSKGCHVPPIVAGSALRWVRSLRWMRPPRRRPIHQTWKTRFRFADQSQFSSMTYETPPSSRSILDARCAMLAPPNFGFRISDFGFAAPSLDPPPGTHSRRGAVAEGLVARAARRGQLARVSVPDGRVSRAAAEARSGSGGGGEAAAPTSNVTGQDQAPRNRSAAEIPRSRRVWASGFVSPTGARRDRSRDRPDRAEGGKRGQRSGIGAITHKLGGASFGRQ